MHYCCCCCEKDRFHLLPIFHKEAYDLHLYTYGVLYNYYYFLDLTAHRGGIVVVVSSSHQSPSLGVSLFRSALTITIQLSVWSASNGSQKGVGCLEANDRSCGNGCALSGLFNPRIRLWPVPSCIRIVFVFLGNVRSAVAMGGGRPISSLDELLPMTVQTTFWWMLLITDCSWCCWVASARYCWLLA